MDEETYSGHVTYLSGGTEVKAPFEVEERTDEAVEGWLAEDGGYEEILEIEWDDEEEEDNEFYCPHCGGCLKVVGG